MVPEQQQPLDAGFGRRHDQGPEPVAGLEQQVGRQTEAGSQIKTVLADHQHQIGRTGRVRPLAQGLEAFLEAIREALRCTTAWVPIRARPSTTPKASLLVRTASSRPRGKTSWSCSPRPAGTRGRRLTSSRRRA